MLEILKFITDVVSKALPQVATKKTEGNRRKLGASLFAVYVLINDLVLRGEMIVASLERYVDGCVSGSRNPADRPYGLSVGVLQEQTWRIVELAGRVSALGAEFQVLDPRAYADLHHLLFMKSQHLHTLSSRLRHWEDASFRQHLDIINDAPIGQQLDMISWASHRRQENDSHSDHLPREFVENYLEILHGCAVDPDSNELVLEASRFLKDGRPHERLEAIRASAEQLRSALLQVFELKDILMDVGKKINQRGEITDAYFR